MTLRLRLRGLFRNCRAHLHSVVGFADGVRRHVFERFDDLFVVFLFQPCLCEGVWNGNGRSSILK